MSRAVGISPLVADLITASMDGARRTTEFLIETLTLQRDEAEAELELIRVGVDELLAGPYAPSATAIAAALYPAKGRVLGLLEEMRRVES